METWRFNHLFLVAGGGHIKKEEQEKLFANSKSIEIYEYRWLRKRSFVCAGVVLSRNHSCDIARTGQLREGQYTSKTWWNSALSTEIALNCWSVIMSTQFGCWLNMQAKYDLLCFHGPASTCYITFLLLDTVVECSYFLIKVRTKNPK